MVTTYAITYSLSKSKEAKDMHGALFVLLHVGWFYAGFGGSYLITEPRAPESGYTLTNEDFFEGFFGTLFCTPIIWLGLNYTIAF